MSYHGCFCFWKYWMLYLSIRILCWSLRILYVPVRILRLIKIFCLSIRILCLPIRILCFAYQNPLFPYQNPLFSQNPLFAYQNPLFTHQNPSFSQNPLFTYYCNLAYTLKNPYNFHHSQLRSYQVTALNHLAKASNIWHVLYRRCKGWERNAHENKSSPVLSTGKTFSFQYR